MTILMETVALYAAKMVRRAVARHFDPTDRFDGGSQLEIVLLDIFSLLSPYVHSGEHTGDISGLATRDLLDK